MPVSQGVVDRFGLLCGEGELELLIQEVAAEGHAAPVLLANGDDDADVAVARQFAYDDRPASVARSHIKVDIHRQLEGACMSQQCPRDGEAPGAVFGLTDPKAPGGRQRGKE